MITAYVDGSYLPLAEARVSPMDRGFLFGDGAYEVIPVYSRRAFRLDEHVARLANTLAAMRLANPHGADDWKAIILELVARNPWDDQSVYLQVTRGADTKRNHAFPGPEVKPTVFLMSEPLVTPSAGQRASGIAAVSAADIRWLRCDLKTVSMLANCLLRQHAIDQGCMETVLFRDSFLTEGAASSIFVCKDGVLLVPMRDRDTDALIGMQTIDRDGAKRYLPGSRAKGAVHRLGRGRELWLCEGYATGLSIRAGLAALYRQDQVVVCFSAGNLVEVASALRGRVIADHDASGAGRGAAERTGLPWAMPEEPGDANDLHQRGGIGAVRALLQRALAYRA